MYREDAQSDRGSGTPAGDGVADAPSSDPRKAPVVWVSIADSGDRRGKRRPGISIDLRATEVPGSVGLDPDVVVVQD